MGPPIEFASVLQASVKDGIGNTLGRAVMETLLTLLKHPFQSYAEKPSEFHRDLSTIFGSASVTLEKMVSKELFQKLNMRYPVGSELDFETCVNLARQDLTIYQKGLKR